MACGVWRQSACLPVANRGGEENAELLNPGARPFSVLSFTAGGLVLLNSVHRVPASTFGCEREDVTADSSEIEPSQSAGPVLTDVFEQRHVAPRL
ncbi:unnamed protein product [Lota lota]